MTSTLAVPPAIPELRRRLLLTRLVLELGRARAVASRCCRARRRRSRRARAASRHRRDRGRELRPSSRDLVPAELAEHWQIVLHFLEILPQSWPAHPRQPRARSTRPSGATACCAQQAAIWRRSPPRDPVIAAGLTGGIPAVAELIRVVAGLDRGAVILPGLDRAATPANGPRSEKTRRIRST